jgi:hypothetical protein
MVSRTCCQWVIQDDESMAAIAFQDGFQPPSSRKITRTVEDDRFTSIYGYIIMDNGDKLITISTFLDF